MDCVACKKPIRGEPRIMRLQITGEEPKFADRAKKLGFTSDSWRVGDAMEGVFHKDCFDLAALVWQVAFETRALSPRQE